MCFICVCGFFNLFDAIKETYYSLHIVQCHAKWLKRFEHCQILSDYIHKLQWILMGFHRRRPADRLSRDKIISAGPHTLWYYVFNEKLTNIYYFKAWLILDSYFHLFPYIPLQFFHLLSAPYCFVFLLRHFPKHWYK